MNGGLAAATLSEQAAAEPRLIAADRGVGHGQNAAQIHQPAAIRAAGGVVAGPNHAVADLQYRRAKRIIAGDAGAGPKTIVGADVVSHHAALNGQVTALVQNAAPAA